MKGEAFFDWDETELPPETEEEVFGQLMRAISRHQGAGWFFVQCSPAKGAETIGRLRSRFGKAAVAVMELDRESRTFYREAKERLQREGFKILVVRGVEQTLYGYEDAKRQLGWDEEQIHNYDWQDVPPLLNHLNLMRECLRDNLPCAIVFLLPRFAVKYFIFRAPDFYDWRSGFFEIPEDGEEPQAIEWVKQSKYSEYCELSEEERVEKIVELRQVLDRGELEDVEFADLLVKQGLLFASGKDRELAISCYDKAIRVQKDCHKAWKNRGDALDSLGRCEEAIASFDKAIEIKPDDSHIWRARGFTLLDLDRYEEALANCNKAIELKQDFNAAWGNRGDALRHLGRYEEALTSYDKAIEIKPDYHDAWRCRGFVLSKLGRYEEALSSYDRAVEIKPDGDNAWNLRGNALHYLGRDEEALVSYDRAIELKPDYYYAWMDRGDALDNLGQYKEAVTSFDKAIEIKPDLHYAWGSRGNTLLSMKRYKEALSSCERAIEIKPDNHVAWGNHGDALRYLGKYEEAIISYDKAIKIKSDYHDAWRFRGFVLANLGRYEEALLSSEKAIELNSTNDDYLYRLIAIIFYSLNNIDKTIEYLKKLAEIDRSDAILKNNIGFLYLFQGNTDEAVQFLQEAIALNPSIFHAYFNLGLALSLNEDFEAARQKFQESFENCPKDDIQDRLYYSLNQIILGKQESGFDLLQETLKEIENPNELYLIRGGVLESAEILARFPNEYPGCDRALQLLQSALERKCGQFSNNFPRDIG
ncbi:MAG: tetratricopeptide repeat protein [Cyanobacteriota bacterium]|nr:tetratricopeptide repeat protein [Cyanobacteriota bacterium]